MQKKRGSDEGSIFQRQDGRWCAIISLGRRENGKRNRKCFYGRTQADVQAKLLKARSDHSRGLPVAFERQTVKEFLTTWLEQSLKPSAKPRSYESFSTIAKKHIIPVIGHTKLDKLTPQQVQTLLDLKRKPIQIKNKKGEEQEKAGLSPQTIVNIRTVLRSALGQATKWGLVARNVAALVDAPRIPRPNTQTLSEEEARQFLETVQGERFEAIYVLALTLGLRRGEILGLPWANIDFENKTLRVSQAVQRFDGKLQIAEVKTDRSRRVVAMTESVIKALRWQHVKQARERLASGSHWQDTGLVFTNPSGGPLEPITLHRDFKRNLTAAKINKPTRFHDLRHACASLLLAQGVHLRVIMELLGHSSISLTANTYSHVMPAAMRDVADRMEAILRF
jgi:integrase